MAVHAESPLVVTSKTGFGIIKRLDRVNLSEIRSMRPRHIVRARCGGMQVAVDSAARVAVQTEGLLMTGLTVVGCLFGVQPVLFHPHRAVVRSDLTLLMTTVAVLYAHLSIVLMRGRRPGLGSKAQDQKSQQGYLFKHGRLLHLECPIQRDPSQRPMVKVFIDVVLQPRRDGGFLPNMPPAAYPVPRGVIPVEIIRPLVNVVLRARG